MFDKELSILVADDDFLEYLREQGFEKTIEAEELYIEYADWAKENVEPWPPSGN